LIAHRHAARSVKTKTKPGAGAGISGGDRYDLGCS
jgi:hypothetical protein